MSGQIQLRVKKEMAHERIQVDVVAARGLAGQRQSGGGGSGSSTGGTASANPFVKVVLGPRQVMSEIRRKTLTPEWHTSFYLPFGATDLGKRRQVGRRGEWRVESLR